MARRRASSSIVAFDLVPDDELVEGVPDDVTAETPSHRGERLAAARSRLAAVVRMIPHRRLLAVVAVAVLVVVAGTAKADDVRDHRQAARLVGVPGAVVDLGRAPRERWAVDLKNPMPLAVMDGLLVVAESTGGARGLTLHGVSPDNGKVRWTSRLPNADRCDGADASGGTATVGTADRLVCMTVVGGQPGVTVVDAGGRVLADRLLETQGALEFVFPAGDATLLHLAQSDSAMQAPALVPVEADDAEDDGPWTLQGPFTAGGLHVWREDAVSGDVLWDQSLNGATLAAGSEVTGGMCVGQVDGGPVFASGGSVSSQFAHQLWVRTCGIDAALDLDTGDVLSTRPPFGSGDLGSGEMQMLVGGGYTESLPTGAGADAAAPASADVAVDPASRVFADDRSVVGDVQGTLLSPFATDEASPGLLVTQRTTGLTGYRRADVSELWTVPGAFGTELALTDDTVAVQRDEEVVALDALTGSTRWTRPVLPTGDAPDALREFVVDAAFTDGTRVVVVTEQPDDVSAGTARPVKTWTAYDLASGDRTWTTRSRDAVPMAIAGHLYRFDADRLVALG
ncbi:PQQ-binding-like beta-propeller repeat protein [Xylanimonas sp. McL0601]|uniref:outer membrane protein assembly factor BamB family protein n=1 Tax=Xylanimonas sp. McL0601 TaxID=3414739 RepID=UPI003CF3BE6A